MNKIASIFIDGKIKLPMKLINIFCYYIIPLCICIMLGWNYISGSTGHFGKELGERAVILLLIILFLRPLSQLLPRFKILKKLLLLRRAFGVLMFWCVLGHGLSMILQRGIGSIVNGILQYGWNGYLFWGTLAGVIIFFLGITSNTYSMKLLKRNWKRLHTLVYPALLFTALHVYFITGEINILVIVGIYGVLQLMVWKGVKI